jgi:hypothetical protein
LARLGTAIVWLVVTSTPPSWSVSPAARDSPVIVTDVRASLSTSVNRKSVGVNGRAVSSTVVAVLACATGASLTGVTFSVRVAATVPLAASLTAKSNAERLAPLASGAGA